MDFSTDCLTPFNENGVCIEISLCKKIYSLNMTEKQNRTVLAYVRSSFCGYTNNTKPKVCCAIDTDPSSLLSSKLPPQGACGKVKVSTGKIIGGNVVQLG